ncbi:hypothetical protein GCM10011575_41560 [Microlunatus endophyticus]|uniref:ABC-2 type transporter transmembrane domain-containing protein n=2 Tax=Microlunatus endophyticus TaxID=1716077 RepID=A0A917W8Y6_9ACTN|nr:hypothetical protein GCM10011575_41560 [Microlunatus endophyticus]
MLIMPKPITDFWWLLCSQLLVLRDQWYWYLVQASFVPVSMLIFLWLLTGRHDPSVMPVFVIGSLVSGLSFGGMLSLGQELGGMKDQNAFEHYAALPISKPAFVAAIATRGMLLALPSAIVMLTIGVAAFQMTVTAPMIVIMVISAYALAGFGAIIGFVSPNAQVSSLVTQILQTIILNFGPVYITMTDLPTALRWIARLWPTTYSAEALRQAAQQQPLAELSIPVGILLGFVVASLIIVPMRLSWRHR